MARLGVRSKNAGPFIVTVDIFCGSETTYGETRKKVTRERIAGLLRVEADSVRQFLLPDLRVIKFSFP